MDVGILRAVGANTGLLLVTDTFVAALPPKNAVISSYLLGFGRDFGFDNDRTYNNQESGRHFAPTVIKAFDQRFDDFVAITERYRETSPELLVNQA